MNINSAFLSPLNTNKLVLIGFLGLQYLIDFQLNSISFLTKSSFLSK